MTRFGLLSITMIALFAQSSNKQDSALSVCELIVLRNAHSGRIVTVRGEVRAGGHGPYLAAPATCQYRLTTRGVIWPNIIYLTYPDNRSKDETLHAGFQVDWKSIHQSEEDEKRAGSRVETDSVLKTFTGLFVTFPDLEHRVTPDVPNALRLGFGPVGLGAPAQLLIKSISDIVVIHSGAHK